MQSSGEILKKAREHAGLSLEEVALRTKIRPEILEKIEEEDWSSLPSETYIRGFLANYARAVSVDEDKVLAFFRRQYTKKESTEKKFVWQPIDKSALTLTPASFLSGAAAFLVVAFLLFLVWQYKSFAGTPLLLVYEPQEKAILSEGKISVVGKTDPDARVTINGEEVLVGSEGAFNKVLDLGEGVQSLAIIAINKLGKENKIIRTVEIKPK